MQGRQTASGKGAESTHECRHYECPARYRAPHILTATPSCPCAVSDPALSRPFSLLTLQNRHARTAKYRHSHRTLPLQHTTTKVTRTNNASASFRHILVRVPSRMAYGGPVAYSPRPFRGPGCTGCKISTTCCICAVAASLTLPLPVLCFCEQAPLARLLQCLLAAGGGKPKGRRRKKK